MATAANLEQIHEALKRLSAVDIERLKRPSLGEESLSKELQSREDSVSQLADLARDYAHLLHDDYCANIASTINAIADTMTGHAALESSDYLAQREQFLQQLDAQIESANIWKPMVAGAAILERGLLMDEGIKRESERALTNLRQQTEHTLTTIRQEAEKSIQGAKDLAEAIEARARRTAAKISVKEAQQQFLDASAHDAKRVKLWSILAIISVGVLIGTPLLFIAYWASSANRRVARGTLSHAVASTRAQRHCWYSGVHLQDATRSSSHCREEQAPC